MVHNIAPPGLTMCECISRYSQEIEYVSTCDGQIASICSQSWYATKWACVLERTHVLQVSARRFNFSTPKSPNLSRLICISSRERSHTVETRYLNAGQKVTKPFFSPSLPECNSTPYK
ncbi:hypothetical protein ATANTOWER_019146 [Ataeniobius toweri]|uniref:Uncharacterized protein n=1 Tax=Ataeniobius toweri TaxID=208326 RepID=A0ABU7AKC8_9TELE|nr:hypothetical protein [Ataeniobius toweri]